MSRNRQSAKKAGAEFERQIADYLAAHVDKRIDRRVKNGNQDRGDIGGLYHWDEPLVIECKNYGGSLEPGPWLREAQAEAGNANAAAGIVTAKRRGITDPARQFVLMELQDLAWLLTGENRPQY